jgi:predicted  nucleic acid-binding Zn-ribbon protein
MRTPSGQPCRLVAIIAAFNEEDIIGPAVAHLVEQGASIYLLDDGSTDRTVAVAREHAGQGLIAVETLASPAPPDAGTFCLSRILARKAQLARTLDADWFINQDADEFRDSPWPHLTLQEAVALVGRLGWNAIDFEVFTFVPDGQEFRTGEDPRRRFQRYLPAAEFDRLQIRCWKKTARCVDLVSTGGHEAIFDRRRVFPIRFPMRHYPFRSAAHANRKIFRERKPRFDPEERARGWHVQYDQFVESGPVIADPSSARAYDRDAANVALQIRNRVVEAACPSVASHPADGLAGQVKQLEDDIARQSAHATDVTLALEQSQREVEAVRTALVAARHDIARQEARATALTLALEQSQHEVEAARTALVDARHDVARHVAHANDLTEVLGQRERDLEALRAAMVDARDVIARQEAHVAGQALELERQQRDLHALRAARDECEARLAETRHIVDGLSATVDDLHQEVGRVQRDASDLARRLSEVHASRSWRVTAPLRAAWRWLGGK